MKLPRAISLLSLGLLALIAGVGWAVSSLAADTSGAADSESDFGVKVLSLRPTAGGQMLDLRFKVIDPEKSKPVLDKSSKAYIVDRASGKALPVPVTKAGSMRQTTLKPEAGRVYVTLFGNPGRMVKEGSHVDLVIGQFRKEGIVVESSSGTARPGTPPGPAGATPGT